MYCVAQDDFDLLLFLHPPPRGWDFTLRYTNEAAFRWSHTCVMPLGAIADPSCDSPHQPQRSLISCPFVDLDFLNSHLLRTQSLVLSPAPEALPDAPLPSLDETPIVH